MKRTFFLIIAFAVISLAIVHSQDIEKLEQLAQEMQTLNEKIEARGGTPTAQEMLRMQQIQQEMMQAMGPYGDAMQQQTMQYQQGEQRREFEANRFPGEKRGWIPANGLAYWGLGALRQPAGTDASYNTADYEYEWRVKRQKFQNVVLQVYLTGGDLEAAVESLKQQVEAAAGKKMQSGGFPYPGHGGIEYLMNTVYSISIPNPDNPREAETVLAIAHDPEDATHPPTVILYFPPSMQ